MFDDTEKQRSKSGRDDTEQDEREEIDDDIDRRGLPDQGRTGPFDRQWNTQYNDTVPISRIRLFLGPADGKQLLSDIRLGRTAPHALRHVSAK